MVNPKRSSISISVKTKTADSLVQLLLLRVTKAVMHWDWWRIISKTNNNYLFWVRSITPIQIFSTSMVVVAVVAHAVQTLVVVNEAAVVAPVLHYQNLRASITVMRGAKKYP